MTQLWFVNRNIDGGSGAKQGCYKFAVEKGSYHCNSFAFLYSFALLVLFILILLPYIMLLERLKYIPLHNWYFVFAKKKLEVEF